MPLSILLLLALLVAACGGSTGSGGTTPTPAATTPAASSNVVMTAAGTVQGKSVTILTDAKGDTLYYFTPDKASTSACTGGCAQTWPPLLMTGSGTPTASTTLPGTLTAVSAGNGNQVEYNGHLLYTFAGDTAPGQTNGEGKFGKWFVATSDLK